jgi:hypothetical protein
MAARLARWAAAALLVGVCWLTFAAGSPAGAQTTTTDVPTTTTSPSLGPVTSGEFHELEQEVLVGLALVVMLGGVHVVGSWRR